MIGRPVKAGETPSGTVQNAPVFCHPVNMVKIRAAMTDAMNQNLNPAQTKKMQFAMSVLQDELNLEAPYPGYNGNPNSP